MNSMPSWQLLIETQGETIEENFPYLNSNEGSEIKYATCCNEQWVEREYNNPLVSFQREQSQWSTPSSPRFGSHDGNYNV